MKHYKIFFGVHFPFNKVKQRRQLKHYRHWCILDVHILTNCSEFKRYEDTLKNLESKPCTINFSMFHDLYRTLLVSWDLLNNTGSPHEFLNLLHHKLNLELPNHPKSVHLTVLLLTHSLVTLTLITPFLHIFHPTEDWHTDLVSDTHHHSGSTLSRTYGLSTQTRNRTSGPQYLTNVPRPFVKFTCHPTKILRLTVDCEIWNPTPLLPFIIVGTPSDPQEYGTNSTLTMS